jgi:ribosomal protein S18 acetylase RimI-like enzyme
MVPALRAGIWRLIDLATPFRQATPRDAAAMTELVHFASEGLALHLWSKTAPPGVDPWEVGRDRAQRESGGLSYRNTILVDVASRVAAGLIGYPLADTPELMAEDLPAMAVPLQELENLVPGTWYVNVLAAYPEHRGKGYGAALLGVAERLARATQRRGLSLIVADSNTGARRLYERCGYREVARRGMVKEGWQHAGTSYVLLTKRLAMQR